MTRRPTPLSRSRATVAALFLTLGVMSPLALAQGGSAHDQAYRDALSIVEQAQPRLEQAMSAVQSGQVAHYDFLQAEHIELIRHARALAYPPATLPEQTRQPLVQEAAALLDAATALEWVFSDFLRAVAQIRSATSNTVDIADQALPAADPGVAPLWQALRSETEQFSHALLSPSLTSLDAAFAALLAQPIPEQTQRELRFQQEQLHAAVPLLQQTRDAVNTAPVQSHAHAMVALYTSAR